MKTSPSVGSRRLQRVVLSFLVGQLLWLGSLNPSSAEWSNTSLKPSLNDPESSSVEPLPRGSIGVKNPQIQKPINLHFEPNYGQTGSIVKFLARGQGYTLLLNSTDVMFDLKEWRRSPDKSHETKISSVEKALVRMRFVGANFDSSAEGEEQLPGKSHYFYGPDRQSWHTDIPQFKKVRYRGIYPGIDLLFHGSDAQLEYDFIIQPGIDPNLIKLEFDGVDNISVTPENDLSLQIKQATLKIGKPFVYQDVDGDRRQVSGDFEIVEEKYVDNRKLTLVKFVVGPYDRSLPLVVDPVVAYSTYLGGFGTDQSNAIAVDNAGQVYLTGNTESVNFPVTAPTFDSTCGSNGLCDPSPGSGLKHTDVFVTKLSSAGAIIYSTYLGGSEGDEGYGIAVDNSGHVYVAGRTISTNFPTTIDAIQKVCTLSSCGSGAGFVTKLAADGSSLEFSTYLSGPSALGTNETVATSIAVDLLGHAYVAGHTASNTFPTSTGVVQPSFGGGFDAFVTKLNQTGTGVIYSTYLGGQDYDVATSISLDASGSVFVTGSTNSQNFPTTPGVVKATCSPSNSLVLCEDAFVAKLNSAGTALLYSTYLGGGGYDRPTGIAVDSLGRAVVVGFTRSPDFPMVNQIQGPGASLLFGEDGFATKLSPDGGVVVYSTFLRGIIRGVATDAGGNAYLVGSTSSLEFPILNALQPTLSGVADAFITKLSPSGSLQFSTFFGGSSSESATAVAADAQSNVYVAGFTTSADFLTVVAAQPGHADQFPFIAEAFVVKLGVSSQVADLRLNMVGRLNPPGTEITYTLSVSNMGPDAAPDVSLFDDLPQIAKILSVSTTQGSCSIANQNVTCTLGSINAGANVIVTIVIVGAQPISAFVNTAGVVSSGAEDLNPNNNQASLDYYQFARSVSVRIATPGTGRVISEPAGIDCLDECVVYFDPGIYVSLIPIPANGYAFNGWSGDCHDTGTCANPGLFSATATFLQVSPTFPALNVMKGGNGGGFVFAQDINCGTQCFALFAKNTTVTLEAFAAAGSLFSAWSVPSCGLSNICTVTLDSNKTITAYFNLLPGTIVHHCSTAELDDVIGNSTLGSVIYVTGYCVGNILIRNDKQRILLEGAGVATLTNDFNSNDPVVQVRGKGIAIQGFSIIGGVDGVVVERGGTAVLNNNFISASRGNGVVVDQLSFAVIINSLVSDNRAAGILVSENSAARIGFSSDSESESSPNLIIGNAAGVIVNGRSSARIVGNYIVQNYQDGVQVSRDSQADIADNLISSNEGHGINVAENSMVQLAEDSGRTIFATPNTSPAANSGFAIKCSAGSVVDGRFGSLAGAAGAKSFGANCIDSLKP